MGRKGIMKGKAMKGSHWFTIQTAYHADPSCFASSEYACDVTTAKSWMYRQRK